MVMRRMDADRPHRDPPARLPTGVLGLDAVAEGGLPAGRCTLVVGTAGAGKTVLASQFLAAGAREHGDAGVLITFDETPDQVVRNGATFAWDLAPLVEAGQVALVDASPTPDIDVVEVGAFDLRALIARIVAAIRAVGARRVVLDSVSALLAQFENVGRVRRELTRVVHALNDLGVTSMLTAERVEEQPGIGRFGVEEFVADAVVVLRNELADQRRRRTLEILKLRGGAHQSGEFPFTIDAERGVSVIPVSAVELEQPAATERISFGNPDIDALMGGGIYRDSLVLVSGPTGTGKTLMSLGFVQAAIDAGERAVLMSFEESHNQLLRNASSWLQGIERAEREGGARVMSIYPERMGLEDLLQHIAREIDEYRPRRVALDSLTALERVSGQRQFREFVVRLCGMLKEREIAGLFTNTATMISGGETVTDAYVSTITDGIVLLRYAEVGGEMRRAITVLKMRGSDHDRRIREFRITDRGMRVGDAIAGAGGLIVRHDGGLLEA
jgi:circadian clock protein KaiC